MSAKLMKGKLERDTNHQKLNLGFEKTLPKGKMPHISPGFPQHLFG